MGIGARGRTSAARVVALLSLAALTAAAPASGHPDPTRQRVNPLPVQQAIEPPLAPTEAAECGPGSMPETALQGQVPIADHTSGRAAKGYTCNAELVGRYGKESPQGTIGGFKVERYVDSAGRDCAYYDTTLLAPTSLIDVEAGVNVLDMSDPANPVLTDKLVTPAMLSPHESLVVSQKRGVLAAVLGNPAFYPGLVDVYDISPTAATRCSSRRPRSASSATRAAWPPTGAPSTPRRRDADARRGRHLEPLGAGAAVVGPYDSHGLSISDDGNRAYVAGVDSGLIVLDISEIQARRPTRRCARSRAFSGTR